MAIVTIAMYIALDSDLRGGGGGIDRNDTDRTDKEGAIHNTPHKHLVCRICIHSGPNTCRSMFPVYSGIIPSGRAASPPQASGGKHRVPPPPAHLGAAWAQPTAG